MWKMSQPTDPAGENYIPFARPSIGKEEEEAVLEVLRSGWLTTAGQARAFEREFAAYTGASHALAVSSATAGLHLALDAFGVGPGDKVITSPYTFTATAEIIRYLGADPLFVDIDEESLTIDPEGVEQALKKNPGTKALIPVHLGGQSCRMDLIMENARRHGAVVIEDAAHAFPVITDLGFLGGIGDAGVYSFYATKTMTTGEGGMVITEDPEIARRIGIMRLHGIDREVWDRYTDPRASWKYDVVAPGYKYNLSDMAAALGRVQLKKAELFLRKRRTIAETYLGAFGGADFLELPSSSGADTHAWHLFILRLREEKLNIDRDEFILRLQEAGIGTSVHYIPLHMMSYYRERYGYRPEDFPRSLRTYRRAFSLPIYPDMGEEQVRKVIDAVISTGETHRRREVFGI
jgi:dTDP-4-amino-4,6-dideoxygalactose transaminase